MAEITNNTGLRRSVRAMLQRLEDARALTLEGDPVWQEMHNLLDDCSRALDEDVDLLASHSAGDPS